MDQYKARAAIPRSRTYAETITCLLEMPAAELTSGQMLWHLCKSCLLLGADDIVQSLVLLTDTGASVRPIKCSDTAHEFVISGGIGSGRMDASSTLIARQLHHKRWSLTAALEA